MKGLPRRRLDKISAVYFFSEQCIFQYLNKKIRALVC